MKEGSQFLDGSIIGGSKIWCSSPNGIKLKGA